MKNDAASILNIPANLIVILGPTATGKTKLAVQVAKQLDGEIISADSRQVYCGLDIGTGKDLAEYTNDRIHIPYHLIDIIDPTIDYSVYHFQKDFLKAFEDIHSRKKIPILCGGTGLYLESVLLNYQLAEVDPDPVLRAKLGLESMEFLREKLKKLNPELHNTTDLEHKKRLIRAIEIALHPSSDKLAQKKIKNVIVLGVQFPRDIVRQRITTRLRERLSNGLIEEVQILHKSGISYQRLDYFGLEYRLIGNYLQGEINWNDMFQKLNTAIHQFAKRQMTFFRRMERRGIKISWITNGDFETALNEIRNWMVK